MTEIAINHLTRMGGDRICVAGLHLPDLRSIRPVTGSGRSLTRQLLRSEGGPFEVGAVVELGDLVPRPTRPEVEDQFFRPEVAAFSSRMDPIRYLAMIESICKDTPEQAFGDSLVRRNKTFVVPEGEGDRSLGCVRAVSGTELKISHYGRLRLRLPHREGLLNLPVNDLRLFERDLETPDARVVDRVESRISAGVELLVMLGLTRAWSKGDDDPVHWLQVNGLCLANAPLVL